MLPQASPAFAVDRTLLRRWARTTAIVVLPALIATLTRLQSGGDVSFDLVASALTSSIVDFIRRYATDYTSSDPQ